LYGINKNISFLVEKVYLVILPILGCHFLIGVNRVHHLKVRLAFGPERLYVCIAPLADPINFTTHQILLE
jgi:hypothetical protein